MQPSPSGFTGKEMLVMVFLILVGLGTLSYAALLRVRADSEDKAVLCVVRQMAAAADQYYLENGVTTVEWGQLVGATNYVKAVNPVAHEVYPERFARGLTITVSGIAGTRTITYAP
jgi:type IV pilus assembly protein PilA